jgi:hypothetical protein
LDLPSSKGDVSARDPIDFKVCGKVAGQEEEEEEEESSTT